MGPGRLLSLAPWGSEVEKLGRPGFQEAPPCEAPLPPALCALHSPPSPSPARSRPSGKPRGNVLSSWGAVPVTWLWLPGDPEPPPAPDTGPEAPAEAREGRCSPTVWPSLHRSPAPVLSDRVSHRLSADWPSLGCHRQKGSCEATGTKLSCQSRQARPPPRPSVCPAAHAPQLQPPTRGPTLADLL